MVVVVSVSSSVSVVVVVSVAGEVPMPAAGDIVVAGDMVVVAGDIVVVAGDVVVVVPGDVVVVVFVVDVAGLGDVVVVVVGWTSVRCSHPVKSAAPARMQIYFFIVWVGLPMGAKAESRQTPTLALPN